MRSRLGPISGGRDARPGASPDRLKAVEARDFPGVSVVSMSSGGTESGTSLFVTSVSRHRPATTRSTFILPAVGDDGPGAGRVAGLSRPTSSRWGARLSRYRLLRQLPGANRVGRVAPRE